MPEVAHIEPGPDTFRILLTTDNHVGYMENDQIRGDDSWRTFAEILDIAKEQDVDMIVQGGDLFHVNAPSKKSYYHVMRALREHCWCDKPIEYKLVSDPSDAMATKHFVYPAEYDANVNVGMPLYAISGNHDDATGEELLSPLDILSVSGLLNHYGRVIDNEQITVCPLLFNKGGTNLALYGLHSVREERLMKTMASGNLEFLEPDTTDDPGIQWFNLMCIHQNHVHRPGVKVVEETCLPSFLDFVLWGHEHDCRPCAVQNDITGTYILQAGSSIATSLSEGETLDKHVFVLSVKGKDFALQPIRLKSVRPFVMKDVILSQTGLSATSSNKKEVLNFLIMQVELMIEKANDVWRQNNKEQLEEGTLDESDAPLPLIRLRVEYSGGYEVENPRFFSNRFVGKVANINDVVLYYKRKRYGSKVRSDRLLLSKDDIAADNASTDEDKMYGEDGDEDEAAPGENDIMEMITEKLDDKDLIMLTKKKVSEALETLLEHEEDRSILNKFVQAEEEDHISLLQQLSLGGPTEDEDFDVDSDAVESLHITSNVRDVKKSFRELAKRIKAETRYAAPDDVVVNSPVPPVTAGRGPVMFHGSNPVGENAAVAVSGSKSKKPALSTEFVADSESEPEDGLIDVLQPPPGLHSTSGRGRGRAAARAALTSRRRARQSDKPSSSASSSTPRTGNNGSNLDMLLGRRSK